MAESRLGTTQKDDILARRAKLLRAHQFARPLANQVIQVPQEEGAVTPTTVPTEPTSEPTSTRANRRQHSYPNQDFESNGFASFELADGAPPAPTGEQQITCDLAGLKLDSVPDMLAHAKQQEGSRLVLLPAELRKRIYHLALEDIWLGLYDHDDYDEADEAYGPTYAPGILLTCKRIHHEAMGIYYSSATFGCPSYWSGDHYTSNKRLKRWLTCIRPECASQIRKIGSCIKGQRTVNLGAREADQAEHTKGCMKDIETVRKLAEDIYGRPLWGPEVIKSRLIFHAWHGEIDTWTSDPQNLCAEAFAAYDFGPTHHEYYSLENLSKWLNFLDRHKNDSLGCNYPYPSREDFTEWAHQTVASQDPWYYVEELLERNPWAETTITTQAG